MSKSNAFETELLELIFNNTAIPNIGDAPGIQGSAAAGSLYLSLHTADPGEAGNQSTSEISYTGYARQALARNGTNFVVTGNEMALGVNVDFPEMTGGTGGVVTHWAVGKAASGATNILYSGTVTPQITVEVGTIPRLKGNPSGDPTTITED